LHFKLECSTEVGHWEGDTVEGKGHREGLATIVEMKSKYTIIRKVTDKTSMEMKEAIVGSFINSPKLIKTLTVDNGTHFGQFEPKNPAVAGSKN